MEDSMTDAQTLTDENTLKQLQDKARDLDIEGRSSMDKEQLAEAIADAEGDAPEQTPPAPPRRSMRPASLATNPKVAGPPPVADQPGLGRPANDYDAPGISPNLSTDRVGAEMMRREELAAEHAEAAASDEG